jgi:hypothetical protein
MIVPLRNVLVCVLPIVGLSGCSWVPYLGRNLAGTSCELTATCCFRREAAKLADKAWADAIGQNPQCKTTPAYVDGFKHGFIDYVARNGTGEPPATPPHCYRYPVLRTPEQQQEIEDWYAGFRHGSQVAHAQQWHEGVVVPISQPSANRPLGFQQEIIATPSMEAPVPKLEELPQPKPAAIKPPPVHWSPAKDAVQFGAPVLPLLDADELGQSSALPASVAAASFPGPTLTGIR